jgi:hypothetical protein
MIDADYFRTNLGDQIKKMGRNPTVKMHLTDGTSLILFSTETIAEGYVLVQAYPEGPKAALKTSSELPTLANGIRLAVPYESIARMEVTLDSQREYSLGFPTEAAARR